MTTIGGHAGAGLVAAAVLLIAADTPLPPAAYVADARSVEAVVNANYAYLERLPGGRFLLTPQLQKEAAGVTDSRSLVRFSERALSLLADHHAITGGSRKDSWAVFPSYGDLWVERSDRGFVIEWVREGSPAQKAGVRPGEMLLAVDGVPTRAAVASFWADLGTVGDGERDGYAARVLAAGRRDRERRLTVARMGSSRRELTLPNLYAEWRPQLPPVSVSSNRAEYRIRFNDSLGDRGIVTAFDEAMTSAPHGRRLVLDLTDTPSGGNTTIARAVLGWFVDKPTFYQVHSLPREELETGIQRQWVEQVTPRSGKRYRGPITVEVGRWTGSMGEGMAIGMHALGASVEGSRMAGLLGAIYDYRLERSGQVIKLPTERLYAVDGTAREKFIPRVKAQ